MLVLETLATVQKWLWAFFLYVAGIFLGEGELWPKRKCRKC